MADNAGVLATELHLDGDHTSLRIHALSVKRPCELLLGLTQLRSVISQMCLNHSCIVHCLCSLSAVVCSWIDEAAILNAMQLHLLVHIMTSGSTAAVQ